MARMIELKNISKIYGKEIKTIALDNINLSIEKGEFASIIGQSGSGKSTLLNIIGALDVPTKGEIIVEGKSLKTYNQNELAQFRNEYMGFIFQYHHLLPEFTALENVLIPYSISHSRPTKKVINLAKELIDRVGVSQRMNNKSTNLSGGQQQRIAIARALINRPKMILADEPTGNLDSDTTVEIINLLKEINQEFNTTFIIITHDRHIAAQCSRVLEILDGKITKDYKPDQYSEDESWKELAPCYCKEYGTQKTQGNTQGNTQGDGPPVLVNANKSKG